MERRYPLEPFLRLTGWSMQRIRSIAPCGGEEYRTRLERGVTELIADRLACAAGHDPYVVWPEMLDHQIVDVSAACQECEKQFVPTRKGHRFCSDRCRERLRMRAKYQDPNFAAAKRAARARYYAEAGSYERARERRKYHTDPERARQRARGYYAAHAEEQRRRAAERRAKATGADERVAA